MSGNSILCAACNIKYHIDISSLFMIAGSQLAELLSLADYGLGGATLPVSQTHRRR
jgi:hypothetical protein